MDSSQNNPSTQNLVFEMQIAIKDTQSSDNVNLNFALTADKPINVSFLSLNDVAAVPSSSQGPSRRVGDNNYELVGIDYFKIENTHRPQGVPRGATSAVRGGRVPGYDMEQNYNQCTAKCCRYKAKDYKEEKDYVHEFYGVDYLKKEEPANDPEVDQE